MAAVTIAMVLVIAGVWFALQVYPIFAGRGREVVVTVHLGDSLSTIASELHAAGVIASPFAFRIDDLVQGTPIIRAGSYKLRQGSSFSTIRHVLESRPNVFQLTVLPGLTLHEIATLVAGDRGSSFATSFLHDATASLTPSPYAHGQSLEGLIGARTYFVSASTTPRELIHEMVRDFNRQASTVGLTPSTSLHGLDAYQLIVTASIVEKEGYYPRNMPKVARVIFNRLARGMKLQMDSTVLYYLNRDGGSVTHATEQVKTPYNTYLNSGLTPTPICTVSKDAMAAVLHAPKGTWLYFTDVTKSGDEAFSTTFAQQLRNERIAASRGLG